MLDGPAHVETKHVASGERSAAEGDAQSIVLSGRRRRGEVAERARGICRRNRRGGADHERIRGEHHAGERILEVRHRAADARRAVGHAVVTAAHVARCRYRGVGVEHEAGHRTGADIRHLKSVGVGAAGACVRVRIAVEGYHNLPAGARPRDSRHVVGVEVVRERAALQQARHLRRGDAARTALGLEHQGGDGRRVRGRRARAAEVAAGGVRVARGVTAEKGFVGRVRRPDGRLQTDHGRRQAVAVVIEVNGGRSGRGERFGLARAEDAPGRRAVGPRRRVVATGGRPGVGIILGRPEAARAVAIEKVTQVTGGIGHRRNVCPRNDELHPGLPGGGQDDPVLDGLVGGNVVRGKRVA